MAYIIRTYRDDDAEALSSIFLAAINGIAHRAYSVQQVAAWAANAPSPDRYHTSMCNGVCAVIAADADDNPVGYALLGPDGHLDHLFCHPDHTRQGLAERLLLEAEQGARTAGQTRPYTEASELARPAFERAGYTVLRRRDFDIDGPAGPVAIHNYAMEKLLD